MLRAWQGRLPGEENKYSSILCNRGRLNKSKTRQRVSGTGICRMETHLKLWARPWVYGQAASGRSLRFFHLILMRDRRGTAPVGSREPRVWLEAVRPAPELPWGDGRTSASWWGTFSILLRGDFEVDWSKEKSRSINLGCGAGTQPAHKRTD